MRSASVSPFRVTAVRASRGPWSGRPRSRSLRSRAAPGGTGRQARRATSRRRSHPRDPRIGPRGRPRSGSIPPGSSQSRGQPSHEQQGAALPVGGVLDLDPCEPLQLPGLAREEKSCTVSEQGESWTHCRSPTAGVSSSRAAISLRSARSRLLRRSLESSCPQGAAPGELRREARTGPGTTGRRGGRESGRPGEASRCSAGDPRRVS